MARILAIDYGSRRTGIAVTDPLQIIATGLTTLDTKDAFEFLKQYISTEGVEKIIIGIPVNWDESETHGTAGAINFRNRLRNAFPAIPIEGVDERFTSKMAKDAMLQMGLKKKDRQDKKTVDRIAATIILQEYLAARG
jgi:putative Holliday junction resolvase